MKSRGVFWGVLLITIGAIFVLRNLGVFYFSWYSLRHLWPMLLIILGIALLPIKGGIRIILSFLVAIIAILWLSMAPERYHQPNWDWHWWWGDNDRQGYYDDGDREWSDQLLYEDFDESIQHAVLDLDAVAGEYIIDKTTDHLLKFQREGNIGKYFLRADNAGSAVVLKLDMEERIYRGTDLKNEALISLNPSPTWDLKVDVGAAKIDFDLSPFLVDRIDIDGGASSIKLKLGDRSPKADVKLDAGAAEVIIEVPEDVGCEVKTNTVLSGKKLDGFDKIRRGLYQSVDFGNQEKTITIEVDAALSSLKVIRY